MTYPLFDLGQLVATPGAIGAFKEANEDMANYLVRHMCGDWGEVCPEDAKANREAIDKKLRILSVYILSSSVKIWVITEADRSSTCILLPEEY